MQITPRIDCSSKPASFHVPWLTSRDSDHGDSHLHLPSPHCLKLPVNKLLCIFSKQPPAGFLFHQRLHGGLHLILAPESTWSFLPLSLHCHGVSCLVCPLSVLKVMYPSSHSFNKYLLNSRAVSGTMPSAKDTRKRRYSFSLPESVFHCSSSGPHHCRPRLGPWLGLLPLGFPYLCFYFTVCGRK